MLGMSLKFRIHVLPISLSTNQKSGMDPLKTLQAFYQRAVFFAHCVIVVVLKLKYMYHWWDPGPSANLDLINFSIAFRLGVYLV